MKTTDGRKVLMNKDDDDGHDDRVVDTVCDDNCGLLNKVSGSMFSTNLLCTETGRGEAVCVKRCEDVSQDVSRDVSRDQELQGVYSRQMKDRGLVLE